MTKNQKDWKDERDWESIGGSAHGKDDYRRVPTWIKGVIRKFEKENSGSSLGLLHFVVKGKTFYYRVSFSGQGGPMHVVEQSLIRKKN